jgi:hypothetical protein
VLLVGGSPPRPPVQVRPEVIQKSAWRQWLSVSGQAGEMLGSLLKRETMINTAKVARQLREKIVENSHPLVLEFAPVAFSIVLSVVLYVSSLRSINLLDMTDLGLVSVLPWPFYLSLLLLCAGFILTLKQKTLREPLLFLHVVLLIVMLYGTTLAIEQAPRFNVTWRHVGLVDYVQRNQPVNRSSDPYLDWPGFFILSAFVANIAGLKSILGVAAYAPIYNNLLYLGALLMVFRSTTRNQRLVWLAIWLFFITNWIGQDYFSPQGLNYALYLTILGIILLWFQEYPSERFLKILAWPRFLRFLSPSGSSREQLPSVTSRRRLALSIFLVILVAFSVASHQLTPFAILFCVTALTVFYLNSFRALPLIIGLLIGAWIIFMARAFVTNDLVSLLQHSGHIQQALNQGLLSRLAGSPGHVFIIRFRLVFTAVVWGLAALGMFLRFRDSAKNHASVNILSDVRMLLLALAPFVLIPLQSYGGEILLRVYLFTLPFMIFFVASTIYAERQIEFSGKKAAVTGLLSIALIGGFFVARYGNEKVDQFTANEVNAVQWFYDHAGLGSLLAAPSPHYPVRFEGYEQYKLKYVPDAVLHNDVQSIIAAMSGRQYPEAYFIITRSQQSYFSIFYADPVENWKTFESALLDSGHLLVVYSNPDAIIFRYTKDKPRYW